MGQLDVGLRRSLQEMVHSAHFSGVVLIDLVRTGRIKEELLSVSGLLHTLAANANGKRSQPPFNLLCLCLNCGRKLANLETLRMYQEPFCCHEKVLPLIEFIRWNCRSLNLRSSMPTGVNLWTGSAGGCSHGRHSWEQEEPNSPGPLKKRTSS